MLEVITTIAPIFIIIFLGAFLRAKGFFTDIFLAAANGLIYYVAIPAMIFRVIAKTSFADDFNLLLMMGTLIPVALTVAIGLLVARALKLKPFQRGTFAQISYHCNFGYIGLAVAYYYLGEQGLAKASVVAGFLGLFQNVLSVVVLGTAQTAQKGLSKHKTGYWIRSICFHPVILSTLAGILFSLAKLSLPVVLDKTLDMLGNIALPMALLIVGASLSLKSLRDTGLIAAIGAAFKLVLLPTIGTLMFWLFDLAAEEYLPALILLAAPTATMAYVMGREMGGDPELASTAISVSTLGSAITYIVWLGAFA